jgi:hypothetical protein
MIQAPGGGIGPGYVLQLLFCEKKISSHSTTTKAAAKMSTDMKSIEFLKLFDVSFNKFKNNQILINKCSHCSNQALYWAKDP